MFKEQYPTISFYEMNQIADKAAANLKAFDEKSKSMRPSEPEPEIEEEKEATATIKAAPKNQKDLNKLLMGAMAPKKKAKKGGKPKMDSKPTKELKKDKPSTKSTSKIESEGSQVEENKEERVKRDLKTVNAFFNYKFMKACTYINSICEIYELASKGKSDELLDKIIYQNVHVFIELLRYPFCNFIIKKMLPRLLRNNSGENKILKIKDCLIECLLLSAKLLNLTIE
jgi:hypothetical protein